jgi:hypothetical protein
MKDPCDDCLIKVNCTKTCEEKDNFTALLKDAEFRNTSKGRITDNYVKYSILQNHNYKTIHTISKRNESKFNQE